MAPETILSVLSRKNPTPRPWSIGPGPNTIGKDWQNFDNWRSWNEFNYKKLRAIFKEIVEAPWKNAPRDIELSDFDLTYGDEDGFEHQILSRETIGVVNSALRHAQMVCNCPAQLHLGRRGRCHYGEDNRLNPDWTLVDSTAFLDNGKFASIMPGDTKLSARWDPSQDLNDQWRRPVRQILTYSNDIQCRYGFLITDNELVVFQFARESVGPGIATTRGTRTATTTQTHQRVLSDSTQLSESVQAMSISESSGAQSYVESGKGFEYQDPKYQIIPWVNEGKEVLTVRLGLFYLCMMAGYGASDIRTGYCKLDTWCRLDDGSYQHNTSGFTKRKLGSKDVLEDPETEGADSQTESVHYNEGEAHWTGLDGVTAVTHETVQDTGDAASNDDEEEGLAGGMKGKMKGKTKRIETVAGGGSEQSLPKLESTKPIVEVTFFTHKGHPSFKSRSGEVFRVRKNDWAAVEYQGHSVMLYKGRKTNYIADELPI
ncbi:hypothetical protein NPX13_g2256 [Xylaria arbuscula]|uniref:Uncharacterized protein n=1 Tax=Xylaria arbuscula TaxID=114810 RepID=A0A9W8NJY6_9PEZI|nr:hypothetical protein NPX13_g2256 [Xylaria arbuscula]